jgi:hypothetical protein
VLNNYPELQQKFRKHGGAGYKLHPVDAQLEGDRFQQPLNLSKEKLVSKLAFSNGSTCTSYNARSTRCFTRSSSASKTRV